MACVLPTAGASSTSSCSRKLAGKQMGMHYCLGQTACKCQRNCSSHWTQGPCTLQTACGACQHARCCLAPQHGEGTFMQASIHNLAHTAANTRSRCHLQWLCKLCVHGCLPRHWPPRCRQAVPQASRCQKRGSKGVHQGLAMCNLQQALTILKVAGGLRQPLSCLTLVLDPLAVCTGASCRS